MSKKKKVAVDSRKQVPNSAATKKLIPRGGEPAATHNAGNGLGAGTARAVRRLTEGEWNKAVTRAIAREKTLVPGTTLDDELGGEKLGMFDQRARDLYVTRCVDEAKHRGHPVADSSKIPAEKETVVREVGDALFDNSDH